MNNLHSTLEVLLALGDAVIITDISHRILAVNPAYEKITGYAQDEIVGRKAGILRTPHTPLQTYASMHEAIQNGSPWSGVFTNSKRTGGLWHSSITITPFVIEGDTYLVGIFRELERLESGHYLDEGRMGRVQGSLLKVLAISCEIRDPGIEAHLTSVQKLTELLVARHVERCGLSLSAKKQSDIIGASILHDIGKSAIPEGILYKPGPLADYERKIIQMHTLIGVDIVDKIFRELDDDLFESELSTAKNIILHHHERWDGSGYPHKLGGLQIPLEARLVSVVDVLDALVTKRPYKEKWPLEQAVRYLAEQKGKQFDADVVDSLVSLYEEGRLKAAFD
ncbi:putative two-component system response regulator [Paenibacillus sp. UNCCL117]|uniref:HD domain-containing phosphohydrolase n=1 Tax=unclassified Paenibacillus TaxID=185978 RepID=UPI00088B54B0|nr:MULTISPECIES: HD domain-containing phosphohydrolase [unclassified Paenibacillus]SDE46655.1 putative two-component system response regulator [Paenibacillus sp. cl123]SFW65815.1 putative two-component system response regulator [Paenibacillus sp. UNCCL117]